MVRRWNNGPSTASVGPHLASSSSLQLAPSLIQSMDQQHGPSMHIRSIGAYHCCILSNFFSLHTGIFSYPIDESTTWSVDTSMVHRCLHCSILSFSSTSGTGLLSDMIDDLPRRSVDPFVALQLVKIPRVVSRCLELQWTTTTYGPSMEWRAIDGFVGHIFCTIFCISILNDSPAKHR